MDYTSHADLGGQSGHGAVLPEPEGEIWHEAFEPRALALTLAMGATGAWNIDQSRAARETLPGYAGLSYYRVWLAGLQRLMAERGLVSEAEIIAEEARQPALPVKRVLAAADVPAVLAKGSSTLRPATSAARFKPGDSMRTRTWRPPHHTRQPAYASGKPGLIERVHGCHVFAESHAQGLGEQPQWLYTVVFDGQTLWGADAQHGLQVSVDAWESTLEPGP